MTNLSYDILIKYVKGILLQGKKPPFLSCRSYLGGTQDIDTQKYIFTFYLVSIIHWFLFKCPPCHLDVKSDKLVTLLQQNVCFDLLTFYWHICNENLLSVILIV